MNIATPAEGPSFGIAPAGTWTWMSLASNSAGSMPSPTARLLTSDSAACALSRMTSPSCPVRIRPPLPGTRVASMNRMSPPTGVQASPVATPGMLVRILTSPSNRRGPRIACRSSASIVTCVGAALGDLHRGAAQGRADLAFEIAHPGLARVAANDFVDRRVGQLGLLGLEAVGGQLPADQIAARDLELSRPRYSPAGR